MEPAVEVETVVGPLLLARADSVIGPALSRWKVWETAETRYLKETLRPGQTFVDVGANVGYFSVLAAQLVGPTGTVIAVEPEARNLDLLYRNLARNGCEGALVIPYAAHSAGGTMTLSLDEENRGGHRLVPRDHAGVCVRCVRLDDVLPERVDVVKIDVQGYDHEVIEGLQRTLAANRGATVIAELSRTELERRGVDREAVLARYEALDFTLSLFDRHGELRRVSAAGALAASRDPDIPAELTLVLERPAAAPFSIDSSPTRVDGLEVNETPDGLIVFQPTGNRAHELNHTAAIVFDLCTGERSIASMVQLVQKAYELPEPPTAEVEACLDRLRREGVIV